MQVVVKFVWSLNIPSRKYDVLRAKSNFFFCGERSNLQNLVCMVLNNNLSRGSNSRTRNYLGRETGDYFPSDPIYSSKKWVANCADYVVCDYNRPGSAGVADYLRGTLKPGKFAYARLRDFDRASLVRALNSLAIGTALYPAGTLCPAKSLLPKPQLLTSLSITAH